MALSDADRAAVLRLKAARDEMAPSLWGDLERVLLLAGLEPPEPASGTFWLDEEEGELWVRDDMAATGENDLDRWWCTGNGGKFSWIQVHRVAPKLVELVRKGAGDPRYNTLLVELYGSWQAWHHNNCGRREPISKCQYHECVHRWSGLLEYGFDKAWEQS